MRNEYELSEARDSGEQTSLFPRRSRDVCEAVGLNRIAALRLRDHGWLSFDPEAYEELDGSKDAELALKRQ